ncbi:MAG: 4Fe-4S binding protein [Bacillota bacterium]|nr:4Fe-4S binding protein [Bacillota bacterium]
MGKKKFKLKVHSERCKECGICFAFCPEKILEPGEDGTPVMTDHDKCIGCKLCEYLCPDFAIEIIKDEDQSNGKKETTNPGGDGR